MAEQTADAYDFADFGFGDALDDALAGLDEADQIGAILKLKAEQVDREVRRLLQTAFATFKEAGRWYWQVAREGCSPQGVRLDWVPKRGSAYWVDEFPVRIAISPSDWLASLVAELLPSDEQWYDQEELAAALAEWRAALDEAETRLRQHFGK